MTPPLNRARDKHTEQVTSVAFGPEGTRIVTNGHDKTAQVWNAVFLFVTTRSNSKCGPCNAASDENDYSTHAAGGEGAHPVFCNAASDENNYSTVTLLARFRGLSTSQPRKRAAW
jgi:WD40 repeat protein